MNTTAPDHLAALRTWDGFFAAARTLIRSRVRWLARYFGLDADDLEQEATLSLWRRHARYFEPDRVAVSTFVYQLTWRVALAIYKRRVSARKRLRECCPLDPDGEPLELADERAVSPHDAATAAERSRVIAALLARLPPREQKVIRMRFGWEPGPQTFREIGAAFGLTQERIRQIEQGALLKLAEMLKPVRGRFTFRER